MESAIKSTQEYLCAFYIVLHSSLSENPLDCVTSSETYCYTDSSAGKRQLETKMLIFPENQTRLPCVLLGGIENFAHFRYEGVRRKRFLQEGDIRFQNAMVNNRIIRIA